MTASERRIDARLRLSYPIRIQRSGGVPTVLGQTVTRDLSARGAFFSTADGDAYSIGQEIEVSISVPHRFAAARREVLLDLRGPAQVVRLERPIRNGPYGEDGPVLTGVALRFGSPLHFRYAWV